MRPPIVHLSIAYGAGLWAGLAFSVPRPLSLATGVAGLLAAASSGWGGVVSATGAVGLLSGTMARERRSTWCVGAWVAGRHAATVRVHDRPGRRGLTTATVLDAPEGCGGQLVLRADSGLLPAGARAVVIGPFRAPAVMRVTHVRVLRSGRPPRDAVRAMVARRIERLYGPRAPLVEALVLGRRADLDPGWRRTFADAGIAHLLAISGLHVGIVAGWTLLLAGLAVRRQRAPLVTAGVVWGYVSLLGFPASAVRAAAFVTLHAVARARQRHPPADAVLSAAVLAVLALDPLAATETGAWLSVAATWGTGFALHQLPAPRRRQPLVGLLTASAGATLSTAPITAFAFGTVAPVGLLTNLVAVPLAGVTVPAVFASLIVGGPLASGAGLALAALERCAVLASGLPGGQVRGIPGPAFAAPWLLALATAIWLCRRRPRLWALAARAAAVLAAGAWAAVVVRAVAARPAGGLSIYVLDVGQGDAIALRTPHGHWVLVDGGPRTPAGDAGRTVVLPFLRRHGAQALDVVVSSHGDADHLGGLPAVVEAMVPDLVLEPGQPLGTPLYLDYQRVVDASGVAWRAARAGDTLVLDSVTLAVLHPTQAWVDRHLAPNENSVALRVSYGDFDAVLVGDAGLPAESALVRRVPPTELLKVGHHGSAGASGAAWLQTVGPQAAVISVGPNRYGHPSPEVLGRLAARGIAVFRTDRGGTVTIRTNGRYFGVEQGRSASWLEDVRCILHALLPSSGSSSIRKACTRPPRGSFPTFSTTSRSRPRSSRATFGGRG